MAKYIKGIDRDQMTLFTTKLDDMISEDNDIRVIDAFVDSLDLAELGFERATANKKGNDSYDPRDLLKLYLYGYKKKIRSSRKLEEACKNNIEMMWLVRGLKPNFRTISDFRKNNINSMKEVFKQTVLVCKRIKFLSGSYSQDGVKINAVNSKEKNYTLNKIDERLKRILEGITDYLEELDKMDSIDMNGDLDDLITKEELMKKLEAKRKEKDKLITIRKKMEDEKVSQISLTDKDSRLMKNNGKFTMAYNNQVVVDTESHIVVNYDLDSNPADVGTILKVSKEAKEITKEDVIKNTTDKGYNNRQDMADCLENGIIPEVTPSNDKDSYELEFEYEENEISEEDKKSKDAETIKKCLRSGEIPEVYKDFLSDVEIIEKRIFKTLDEALDNIKKLRDEEMRDLAMKEKCFVKNEEARKVYCPMGETLRPKSKDNQSGGIKYCNKMACKNCKNPCTLAKFKEIIMQKDQVVSSKDKNLKVQYNGKKQKKQITKIKVVKMKLTPKKEDLKKRMATSEHVHGTMKRTDDVSYLLLKGKEKVNGEMGLYYAASNLRRLVNVFGVKELIDTLKCKNDINSIKNDLQAEQNLIILT